MVEVPLGAPEAAALALDRAALAGAPADLRAALAEAGTPVLVLVDPQCTPAQLDRVIEAATSFGPARIDNPTAFPLSLVALVLLALPFLRR